MEFTFGGTTFFFRVEDGDIVIASAEGDLVRITVDTSGDAPVATGVELLDGTAYDLAETISIILSRYDDGSSDGGDGDGDGGTSEIFSCTYNMGATHQCLDFPGTNWTEQQRIDYCYSQFFVVPEGDLVYDTELCDQTGTQNGYCSYENDPTFTENNSGWEHNVYIYSSDSNYGTESSFCGPYFVSF